MVVPRVTWMIACNGPIAATPMYHFGPRTGQHLKNAMTPPCSPHTPPNVPPPTFSSASPKRTDIRGTPKRAHLHQQQIRTNDFQSEPLKNSRSQKCRPTTNASHGAPQSFLRGEFFLRHNGVTDRLGDCVQRPVRGNNHLAILHANVVSGSRTAKNQNNMTLKILPHTHPTVLPPKRVFRSPNRNDTHGKSKPICLNQKQEIHTWFEFKPARNFEIANVPRQHKLRPTEISIVFAGEIRGGVGAFVGTIVLRINWMNACNVPPVAPTMVRFVKSRRANYLQ